MEDGVVTMFRTEEDTIKTIISNTIMRNFMLGKMVHGGISVPPSHVLFIFFRKLPTVSVSFTADDKPLTRDEIAHIEAVVSESLFEIYKNYTQYPSPRDVITDILSKLGEMGVSVHIPQNWT